MSLSDLIQILRFVVNRKDYLMDVRSIILNSDEIYIFAMLLKDSKAKEHKSRKRTVLYMKKQ